MSDLAGRATMIFWLLFIGVPLAVIAALLWEGMSWRLVIVILLGCWIWAPIKAAEGDIYLGPRRGPRRPSPSPWS